MKGNWKIAIQGRLVRINARQRLQAFFNNASVWDNILWLFLGTLRKSEW